MRTHAFRLVCLTALTLGAWTARTQDDDESGECAACGARRAAARAVPTLTVGANVNVSKTAGYQAETAIAINPTNPQKMVVFSNNATTGIFRAFSIDGGQSWTGGAIATGADSLDSACCDPTCCFDKFGTLFFCYLTDDALPATVVYASTDSGATFTKVSTLATDTDQPTIVSGPGATAGSSTVWVLYTDTNGDQVVKGMTTTGLGTYGSFGSAITIPNTNGLGFGDIAIGPVGQVVVAFQDTNSGNGPDTIQCSVNSVGLGGSFTNPVTLSGTNVGGFDNITPQPNRSVDSEVGLAIDTTSGPFRGRTYAVYTDELPNESNNTNIMFRFSDNFGATWSAAVKLNDDATTLAQFFPKISLDPTTGAIAVAWLDCRNDPGSGAADRDSKNNTDAMIYATVSPPGGTAFTANAKISAGSTNSQLQSDLLNEFGDYIGIAFYGGNFYPAWPDNSNSTGNNPDGTSDFDIYTAKVGVSLNLGPSATTIAAANATAQTSPLSQDIVLSATVSSSSTVNEGTVTFQVKNGANNVGSAATSGTVSNGAASVTYTLPATLSPVVYTIVATFNATANFSTSSDNTHTLTVTIAPVPPVFTSGASAQPNPAQVNQAVQFDSAATSATAVTYSWNFGDGSTGTGSSPTHAYPVAGMFTATVTATNADNLTATSSVVVTINAATTGIAVLPGEIDSDGDGYSDNVENAAGTSPQNFGDNPGNGAAPVKLLLTQTRFVLTKRQRLTFTGTLAIPANFAPDGLIAVADIAGYARGFFLNARGSGKNLKDTFRVTIRKQRGVVLAQTSKFTLVLNNVPSAVVDGAPLQIVIGNLVFAK